MSLWLRAIRGPSSSWCWTAWIPSIPSGPTKRALADFLAWYQGQGKPGLTKATVQAYKVKLQEDRLSSANVNLRLSAIRKLATEAADNGALDPSLANGISRVKGIKREGIRTGNWLTKA